MLWQDNQELRMEIRALKRARIRRKAVFVFYGMLAGIVLEILITVYYQPI